MSAIEPGSTSGSATRELTIIGPFLAALGAVVLAVLLSMIAVLQGADSVAFTLMASSSGLALGLGLLLLAQALRRGRAARAAARHGGFEWAALCIQPENRYLVRLLLVDKAGGLILQTLSGRQLQAWPWAVLGPAHKTSVEVGGRSKPGLLVDAEPVLEFAFLSPSGIGYSPEVAARGMRAINAHASPAR